jgi:hypothetical protein
MDDAALLPILRAQFDSPSAKITDATLLEANRQLESFFAPKADRKAIIGRLEGMKIDPNLLGRLVRIRRDWPQIPAGVYFVDSRSGSSRARYWLVVPKGYDRTRAWPAVLLLPDPAGMSVAGLVEQVRQRAADMQPIYPKSLIIVPLPDLQGGLGPGRLGMALAMAALNDAADLADIDPARVELMGHGQAALWAWNLALNEPTYFSTLEALAGNAQITWLRLRMMGLSNLKIVIWNDTHDPLSKIDAVRGDAEVAKRFVTNVRFEQTTGIGHDPAPELLARLAEGVSETRRDLYPPRVSIQSTRIEPTFNRSDWVLLDQPSDGGTISHVLAARGSEIIWLYDNTFRVDASLKDNHIDVKTDNVASLRLFLNDQMVDFAKPVVVTVNGREFHRVVTPSLATMLADQLFLGRGWRYFTGTIDIDLEATTEPTTGPTTGPSATTGPSSTSAPAEEEPLTPTLSPSTGRGR